MDYIIYVIDKNDYKTNKKSEFKKFIIVDIIINIIVSLIIIPCLFPFYEDYYNSIPNFSEVQGYRYSNNTDAEYPDRLTIEINNTKEKNIINACATLHYFIRFYGYDGSELLYEFYYDDNHPFYHNNFYFQESSDFRNISVGEAFRYIYEDTSDLSLIPNLEVYAEIHYTTALIYSKKTQWYRVEYNSIKEISEKNIKELKKCIDESKEYSHTSLWHFYDTNRQKLNIHKLSNRSKPCDKENEECFKTYDDIIKYLENDYPYYNAQEWEDLENKFDYSMSLIPKNIE